MLSPQKGMVITERHGDSVLEYFSRENTSLGDGAVSSKQQTGKVQTRIKYETKMYKTYNTWGYRFRELKKVMIKRA